MQCRKQLVSYMSGFHIFSPVDVQWNRDIFCGVLRHVERNGVREMGRTDGRYI